MKNYFIRDHKMLISFVENNEILGFTTCEYLHINNGSFSFYSQLDISNIGDFLIDVLECNFENFDNYYSFLSLYGLSCMLNISNKAQSLVTSCVNSEAELIKNIREVWKESLPKIIELKKEIKDIVDFCFFESNNKNFAGLSPIQKFYLYNGCIKNITDEYSSQISVSFDAEPEDNANLHDNEPIGQIEKLNRYAGFIRNKKVDFIATYGSISLGALCFIELMEIFKRNMLIKKCAVKSCNSYFIPEGRPDIIFCSTCRKKGAHIKHKDKVNDDPILKLYNSEYQRRYAKIRNYDKEMRKRELCKLKTEWVDKAKAKMNDPGMTIELFQEWIDSEKER